MFAHLKTHRLWDLIASAESGTPAELAHLERCASCASRLARGRGGHEAIRLVADEPLEASPLYWESMRESIRVQISAVSIDERLAWPRAWITGFAATAVVVALAALTGPERSGPMPAATAVEAWAALPSIEDDPALDVLRAAVLEAEGVSAEDLGYGPALVAVLEGMDDDNAVLVARSLAEGRLIEGGVL